jgi:hypothetical protein
MDDTHNHEFEEEGADSVLDMLDDDDLGLHLDGI